MPHSKSFQVNNEYCKEFTVNIDDNGKISVTFEPILSYSEACDIRADIRADIFTSPSALHPDQFDKKRMRSFNPLFKNIGQAEAASGSLGRN